MEKLTGCKQNLFLSAVFIALGITLTTILKDNFSAIGTVFIAIGGLLFIAGMKKRRNLK